MCSWVSSRYVWIVLYLLFLIWLCILFYFSSFSSRVTYVHTNIVPTQSNWADWMSVCLCSCCFTQILAFSDRVAVCYYRVCACTLSAVTHTYTVRIIYTHFPSSFNAHPHSQMQVNECWFLLSLAQMLCLHTKVPSVSERNLRRDFTKQQQQYK